MLQAGMPSLRLRRVYVASRHDLASDERRIDHLGHDAHTAPE